MDIKHFALFDWVGQDLVVMKWINTTDNCADPMTKYVYRTSSLLYLRTVIIIENVSRIYGNQIKDMLQYEEDVRTCDQ